MEESEKLKLLTEIRDAQREHLAEYRRVAEESLALQKQAVARQEQIAKLYRPRCRGGRRAYPGYSDFSFFLSR